MNKHTYIIVVGLIAIALLILTNFITMNYTNTMSGEIMVDIGYVITVGGIGLLLHRKVKE